MAGRFPSGDPIVTVGELIEALKTWPSDAVLYVGNDTWLGTFEDSDPIWDGRGHPIKATEIGTKSPETRG